MKKCEEFAPLLSAYFDGELTEEERAELRALLRQGGKPLVQQSPRFLSLDVLLRRGRVVAHLKVNVLVVERYAVHRALIAPQQVDAGVAISRA